MEKRQRKAEEAFLKRGAAKAGKAADSSAPAVGGLRVATPAGATTPARRTPGAARKFVKKPLPPLSPHPNAFKSQAFANSGRSPMLNIGRASPRVGLLSSPDPPPRAERFLTPAACRSDSADAPGPSDIADAPVDAPALATPRAAITPPRTPPATSTTFSNSSRSVGSSLAEAGDSISVSDLVAFRQQLQNVVDTTTQPPRMLSMPPPNVQAAAVVVLCSVALIEGNAPACLDDDLVDSPLPPEAWVEVQERLRALGSFKSSLKKTPQCTPAVLQVVAKAASAVNELLEESDQESCPWAHGLQGWLRAAVQTMDPIPSASDNANNAAHNVMQEADIIPDASHQGQELQAEALETDQPQTPVRHSHEGLAALAPRRLECEDPPSGDGFDCENTVDVDCLKRSSICAGADAADHPADIQGLNDAPGKCPFTREELTSPFILCALTRDVLSPDLARRAAEMIAEDASEDGDADQSVPAALANQQVSVLPLQEVLEVVLPVDLAEEMAQTPRAVVLTPTERVEESHARDVPALPTSMVGVISQDAEEPALVSISKPETEDPLSPLILSPRGNEATAEVASLPCQLDAHDPCEVSAKGDVADQHVIEEGLSELDDQEWKLEADDQNGNRQGLEAYLPNDVFEIPPEEDFLAVDNEPEEPMALPTAAELAPVYTDIRSAEHVSFAVLESLAPCPTYADIAPVLGNSSPLAFHECSGGAGVNTLLSNSSVADAEVAKQREEQERQRQAEEDEADEEAARWRKEEEQERQRQAEEDEADEEAARWRKEQAAAKAAVEAARMCAEAEKAATEQARREEAARRRVEEAAQQETAQRAAAERARQEEEAARAAVVQAEKAATEQARREKAARREAEEAAQQETAQRAAVERARQEEEEAARAAVVQESMPLPTAAALAPVATYENIMEDVTLAESQFLAPCSTYAEDIAPVPESSNPVASHEFSGGTGVDALLRNSQTEDLEVSPVFDRSTVCDELQDLLPSLPARCDDKEDWLPPLPQNLTASIDAVADLTAPSPLSLSERGDDTVQLLASSAILEMANAVAQSPLDLSDMGEFLDNEAPPTFAASGLFKQSSRNHFGDEGRLDDHARGEKGVDALSSSSPVADSEESMAMPTAAALAPVSTDKNIMEDLTFAVSENLGPYSPYAEDTALVPASSIPLVSHECFGGTGVNAFSGNDPIAALEVPPVFDSSTVCAEPVELLPSLPAWWEEDSLPPLPQNLTASIDAAADLTAPSPLNPSERGDDTVQLLAPSPSLEMANAVAESPLDLSDMGDFMDNEAPPTFAAVGPFRPSSRDYSYDASRLDDHTRAEKGPRSSTGWWDRAKSGPPAESTVDLAALLFPASAAKADNCARRENISTPIVSEPAASSTRTDMNYGESTMDLVALLAHDHSEPAASSTHADMNYGESTVDLVALLAPKSKPEPVKSVPASTMTTRTPVQPVRHSRRDALSSSSYLTTLRYPSPVGRLARYDPLSASGVRKPAIVEESTIDLAALLEPRAVQKTDKHGYIPMPASFKAPLPQTNARADLDCGEETIEFMSLLQPSSERISPRQGPPAHGASAGGASASSSSTDDMPGSVMPNGSGRASLAMPSTGATDATAGLLNRGRRLGAAAKGGLSRSRQALEPSIGTQMATAEQFINSAWRWAMNSAQQALEVANTSRCRMSTWSSWVWFVFWQKILVVVIILICLILLLGELSWRLGPPPEDFL